MEFEAHILKICKIHRKSRIRQTTVLFCKYLANESSDLHEILCGGQLLSCELKFKISWRYVHKCEHTSCKRACARFIASARVYDSYGSNKCQYCFANISPTKALIIMKFCVVVNYYLVSLSLKFHEDPCINVCTPVVNACAHVSSRVRVFTTPVDQTNVSIVLQISRQRKLGSSWNFL